MSHSTEGEWFPVICKDARRRRFTGLHAAVDVGKLMMISVMVRDRPGEDVRMLIPLFEVVYGDKAYLSRIKVTHIHSLGARAVIEPKRGLTGKARGYKEYAKLAKEYRRVSDEWKEMYEYRKRSLVECMFRAVKVEFGWTLRSRLDNRRVAKTLFKVMICNVKQANYLSWFNL